MQCHCESLSYLELTNLILSEYKLLKTKEISVDLEIPSRPRLICDCGSKEFVYDSTFDETICSNCALVTSFQKRTYSGYLPDTFSKIKKTQYCQVEYVKLRLTELQCGILKLDKKMIEELKYALRHKEINIHNVRKSLRILGYKQMYLRIPIILNTLDPKKYPPLKLTARDVNKIVGHFKNYIDKWNKLKDKRGRKNLLNYQFVLKKIFEKLGMQDKTHFLNIPKGKKTLEQHEEIWNLLS